MLLPFPSLSAPPFRGTNASSPNSVTHRLVLTMPTLQACPGCGVEDPEDLCTSCELDLKDIKEAYNQAKLKRTHDLPQFPNFNSSHFDYASVIQHNRSKHNLNGAKRRFEEITTSESPIPIWSMAKRTQVPQVIRAVFRHKLIQSVVKVA